MTLYLCVHGVLRTVTLRPRGGVPALEAELFDGSDSLTELTSGLKRASYFAPDQWGNDNAGDQDLSRSMGNHQPGVSGNR